jgi:hypothetical protein
MSPLLIDKKSSAILREAVPLKNFENLLPKIYMMAGRIDELLNYYHSDADDLKKIKENHLFEAYKFSLKLLW